MKDPLEESYSCCLLRIIEILSVLLKFHSSKLVYKIVLGGQNL